MQTDDIRFWLKSVERLLSMQHEDSVKHLTKVAEMLSTVYTEKEQMVAHWTNYMLIQEVIGNVLLQDWTYATNIFEYVKSDLQKCLKKKF